MCAGNELFFVALYVLEFFGPINGKYPKRVACAGLAINPYSPYYVAMWWCILGVTGVICFAKQFINVVQIVNASMILAAADKEERAKALSAKKE